MKRIRLSRLVRWRQAAACCRRVGVKGDGAEPGVPEGPEGPLTPAWPEVAWRCSWDGDRSLAAVRGRYLPCHGWRWAQFSIALVVGQDQVDGRIAPVAQFE